MNPQPNYDKLLHPIADVTTTIEALLNDSFGKLMGDQREGLKQIYSVAWGLHTLLLDIVTNIGIDNIAKRNYLPAKFDEYLNPLGKIPQDLIDGVDGPLNEGQIVAIDFVRITGALLRRYIDTLCLYSQLKNDLRPLNKQLTPFDVLLDPMQWSVSDAPVELELLIHEDLPHVLVDASLMQSAITQIVENAISHTDEGNIYISVDVDKMVRITIEDSGRGIPRGYQKTVFSAFFQANPDQLGLGLGLTIAQKILLLHEGQLQVTSLADGTRFIIEFPLIEI